MSDRSHDLFNLPSTEVRFADVRNFVAQVEETGALVESITVELKRQRRGNNIVEAVAALANTDGGVVIIGVDDSPSATDRFIGVPKDERDNVITQLRSLLPRDALPEVITVAVPDSKAMIIIVLRVDADRVAHPIVVDGRVYIRLPGQKAPARREDIIALVDRDRRSFTHAGVVEPSIPLQPLDIPLWSGGPAPEVELRFYGTTVLPQRALRRQWFDTAGRNAIVDALTQSPIPHRLFATMRTSSEPNQWWNVTEARASRLRMAPENTRGPSPRWTPNGTAEAYVEVRGRIVEVLLGIGFNPKTGDGGEGDVKLSIGDVYEITLASATTFLDISDAAAASLGAIDPRSPGTVQAWWKSRAGLTDSLSDLRRFADPKLNAMDAYWFPKSSLVTGALEEADELVREWLTLLFLDAGASDFEDSIAALHRPSWSEL